MTATEGVAENIGKDQNKEKNNKNTLVIRTILLIEYFNEEK
jgi:hypothetical protein